MKNGKLKIDKHQKIEFLKMFLSYSFCKFCLLPCLAGSLFE